MAWGKPGVSKVDFGTDVGMCTGMAAMQNTGDGSNTAGGIQRQEQLGGRRRLRRRVSGRIGAGGR